jgi:hypothetical protein
MSPQLGTDMPPQHGPAMRSLRSVHAPQQRRLSAAPTALHPHQRNADKSGLTRPAALWATVQVGRLARPVAQVFAELGVSWHTVIDGVPDGA